MSSPTYQETLVDPVDTPKFNPMIYRSPNPETIKEIEAIAKRYHALTAQARDVRAELDAALIEARNSGHSWHQLKAASGLSVATMQKLPNLKSHLENDEK